MTEFRYMDGFVYILENSEAKRVKVGMTTNRVEERLQDVNEKWLGVRGTCQICGTRRLVGRLEGRNGTMPPHGDYRDRCQGSGALPFERDTALAESHLAELKKKSGHKKEISTLEKRIEQYRKFDQLVGDWRISTVYFTHSAEYVELGSHEILAEHLDTSVPFGEVFSCSVSEAVSAVELVLSQMDLLGSARKAVVPSGIQFNQSFQRTQF